MDAISLIDQLEKYTPLELAEWVNGLIVKDFSGLVQILYRLDVPEPRLKQVLQDQPGEDAGRLIAELIIEQLNHIRETRTKFRPHTNLDIPEEDRW
jgi:hypothetical protein